ncbi:regulatory protein RecX [Thermomonas sp.]|jgi:regulatory protein|uniref:regulatory protein RecX n=1 Tax=Thermomonas sp. TaxID=1971895 RepID=UPI001B4046B7|nr:regulatory protein RecX [Thermomonas sp.]MBK6332325.1 regulatory protein RecX [Thermomonas sp.]MBK6417056.1 regulatory protein RecX [Thermomonas sp.]MBK7204660.1 regulatory protein RecX [Thermomonas sp.]MBL0227092.1 regulatory protein RecX [Thermomonas sp.]MBP7158152.1 regulatory protein RecX [Thermomonas sp.]
MTVPGGDDGVASSSAPKRRRPEPSPLQRALGLLTRREHSRQELARKLQQRGVEREQAAAAIDKLTEAGWQDDARFAESVVRSRAASGYGPAYIRAELATHGLASEAIARVLDGFDGDWTENARALVCRRHPLALDGDRDARCKAADLLLRRGFSMEQVRAAVTSD